MAKGVLIKKKVKITVMGSTSVGKSALCLRFTSDYFPTTYDPTLEDCFHRRLPLIGSSVVADVEVLDTAGTDQFIAMRDMYMRSGQVFIIVYSLASYDSLLAAGHLIDRLGRVRALQSHAANHHAKGSLHYAGQPLVVLVGNKCDLLDERQVSPDLALRFAAHHNLPPPWETSAKTGFNVDQLFTHVTTLYLDQECSSTVHSNCPSACALQ